MDIKSILESLEDIYEYSHEPYLKSLSGKMTLFVVGVSFAAGLGCLGVVLYEKVFKGRLKPWDKALHELDQVYGQYKNGQGGVRQLYFDLTGIVKCLIEGHFGVAVLGKTDTEVLLAMKSSGIRPEVIKTMDDLFCRAQSVKFASQSQVQDQVLRDVAMIKSALSKWAKDAKKR